MRRSATRTDATLLLKPRPFASESLVGYQLRVAEANGYSSGIWMLKYLIGIPRITINSSEHAARVTSFFGLAPEELNRFAYVFDGVQPRGSLSYYGQQLHLRHLRLRFPAVCPRCLNESAATNGFWDLKYSVACPFHGSRLIDICQQCGNKISWNRSKICECPRCEFDYRKLVTEIASPEVLELTRLVYGTANIFLIGVPDSDTSIKLPLEELKSESLSALLWMIDIVARNFEVEPANASAPLKNSYSDRLSQEYEAVRATAFHLMDWPERFLGGIYQNLASRTGSDKYETSLKLLTALTRQKVPQILQQIGYAFIDSATKVHGAPFKVDEQTLKHARQMVATCCY